MAKIKGWKLISKHKLQQIWESKSKDKLGRHNYVIYNKNPYSNWYPYSVVYHKNKSQKIETFKTKKEAIKFAKNWMRNHSRG